MSLFVILVLMMVLFWFAVHKPKRMLKYGNFKGGHFELFNKHRYYVEEANFLHYQDALSTYYKVVDDVASHGEILEVKYDLYDWTVSIYRFADTTIGIHHLRSMNKIQIIKSNEPVSISTFEMDHSGLRL